MLRHNEISRDAYMDLALEGVERVPERVDTVVGDVNLYDPEGLISLPDGIKVIQGNLYLYSCTPLVPLPEGLTHIEGYLYLRYTQIKDLEQLQYVGKIYCDRDFIDAIPYDRLPLYLRFKFYLNLTRQSSLDGYLRDRLKRGY